MTAQPCICPTNDDGQRTATDPKCFDHAPWNRHPSDYVVRLQSPWAPCYEAENHVSDPFDPFSGPDVPLTTFWRFSPSEFGCVL